MNFRRLWPRRVPRPVSLIGGLLALFLLWTVGRAAFWLWVASQPRMNIVLLGLDRRPDEGFVARSDTLMLLTVDPGAPQAALLSIPRDLYVEIPGYGANRINTAHFWGEYERSGGGPALTMQTIWLNFGGDVERYVRVDFDGFRAVVDAAGGVDLVVERPIVDDEYPTDDYGTLHIEIPAGRQHMDGETALRYARSRHGSSDFDRARRQQAVLAALARRLLSPGGWLRWPAVYKQVSDALDTNLTDRDWLLLAAVLYRVGPDGIEYRAIDDEMVAPWTTADGGAVLLPRWESINPLIQELFQ